MLNCSESPRSGRAARALCDGKFGLVRYYAWHPPLFQEVVDRFRARRQVTAIGCLAPNRL